MSIVHEQSRDAWTCVELFAPEGLLWVQVTRSCEYALFCRNVGNKMEIGQITLKTRETIFFDRDLPAGASYFFEEYKTRNIHCYMPNKTRCIETDKEMRKRPNYFVFERKDYGPYAIERTHTVDDPFGNAQFTGMLALHDKVACFYTRDSPVYYIVRLGAGVSSCIRYKAALAIKALHYNPFKAELTVLSDRSFDTMRVGKSGAVTPNARQFRNETDGDGLYFFTSQIISPIQDAIIARTGLHGNIVLMYTKDDYWLRSDMQERAFDSMSFLMALVAPGPGETYATAITAEYWERENMILFKRKGKPTLALRLVRDVQLIQADINYRRVILTTNCGVFWLNVKTYFERMQSAEEFSMQFVKAECVIMTRDARRFLQMKATERTGPKPVGMDENNWDAVERRVKRCVDQVCHNYSRLVAEKVDMLACALPRQPLSVMQTAINGYCTGVEAKLLELIETMADRDRFEASYMVSRAWIVKIEQRALDFIAKLSRLSVMGPLPMEFLVSAARGAKSSGRDTVEGMRTRQHQIEERRNLDRNLHLNSETFRYPGKEHVLDVFRDPSYEEKALAISLAHCNPAARASIENEEDEAKKDALLAEYDALERNALQTVSLALREWTKKTSALAEEALNASRRKAAETAALQSSAVNARALQLAAPAAAAAQAQRVEELDLD